jgi:hypothetical protein
MATQRSKDLKVMKANGQSRASRRQGTKARKVKAPRNKWEGPVNISKDNQANGSNGKGKNEGGPSRTEKRNGSKSGR